MAPWHFAAGAGISLHCGRLSVPLAAHVAPPHTPPPALTAPIRTPADEPLAPPRLARAWRTACLLNQLGGLDEDGLREGEAERLGGLEVDHEVEQHGLFNG